MMGEFWSDRDTRKLVDIWSEEAVQNELNSNRRGRTVFKDIAARLRDLHVDRTDLQVKCKIKNLKMEYNKLKLNGVINGRGRQSTKFFRELDRILGYRYSNIKSEPLEDTSSLGTDTEIGGSDYPITLHAAETHFFEPDGFNTYSQFEAGTSSTPPQVEQISDSQSHEDENSVPGNRFDKADDPSYSVNGKRKGDSDSRSAPAKQLRVNDFNVGNGSADDKCHCFRQACFKERLKAMESNISHMLDSFASVQRDYTRMLMEFEARWARNEREETQRREQAEKDQRERDRKDSEDRRRWQMERDERIEKARQDHELRIVQLLMNARQQRPPEEDEKPDKD